MNTINITKDSNKIDIWNAYILVNTQLQEIMKEMRKKDDMHEMMNTPTTPSNDDTYEVESTPTTPTMPNMEGAPNTKRNTNGATFHEKAAKRSRFPQSKLNREFQALSKETRAAFIAFLHTKQCSITIFEGKLCIRRWGTKDKPYKVWSDEAITVRAIEAWRATWV